MKFVVLVNGSCGHQSTASARVTHSNNRMYLGFCHPNHNLKESSIRTDVQCGCVAVDWQSLSYDGITQLIEREQFNYFKSNSIPIELKIMHLFN